jgi:hypothetical protein
MGFNYRKEKNKNRICNFCKKKFIQKSYRRGKIQKFCSQKCASKNRIKKRPKLICKNCSRIFNSDRINRELSQQFCSRQCQFEYKRNNKNLYRPKHKERECLNCNIIFHRPRSRSKFCSHECYHSWTSKNVIDKSKNFIPGINKTACDWFEKLDKKLKTKGKYGLQGNGEYRIPILGYYLDYINFKLKIIIECDEESHYHFGKLKKKDLKRQKEIKKHFKSFKFFRIKQSDKIQIENFINCSNL